MSVQTLTLQLAPGAAARRRGLRETSSDAPATLEVSGLSAPIYLVLPSPPLAPNGTVNASSLVQFWDPVAGVYDTAGLVTQPNPAPAAANISWRPGFEASGPADLPLAWALAHPGCAEIVVNCSDPTVNTLAVSLDPQQSLGDPVVSCGANQTDLMRVYVGHDCPLWQPNATCAWNVTAQAFQGAACAYNSLTHAATARAPPAAATYTLSCAGITCVSPLTGPPNHAPRSCTSPRSAWARRRKWRCCPRRTWWRSRRTTWRG